MMDRGLRTLLVIWLAQLVSMIGTGLTGFAMGIWIFQRTGSVTRFAFIVLSTTLPGVIVAPFAGWLVDHCNRRWVMIICDLGAATSVLLIALLLIAGQFQLWHFFAALAAGAVCGVFRELAFTTILQQLVSKQHFGRVSGLIQAGYPVTRIVCPLVAGTLLGIIPIQGVILIDFCTFFSPILTMLLVRLPTPENAETGKRRDSLLRGISSGWTFIAKRQGVLVMLIYFMFLNFTMGLAHALYQPLLLSFASVKTVGLMSTIGGCGILTGSLIMGVWGGPKRRVRGLFCFGILYGAGLAIAGLRESVPLIGAAFFGMILGMPIIFGSMQAMWLSKTPAYLQGRVFAVWTMIMRTCLPLAYVVAGPLADRLFIPLLREGGMLSGSVGAVIGTGPGRGIGLMYITIGVLVWLVTTASYLHPRFRLVENELPDVVKDRAPVGVEESYA